MPKRIVFHYVFGSLRESVGSLGQELLSSHHLDSFHYLPLAGLLVPLP